MEHLQAPRYTYTAMALAAALAFTTTTTTACGDEGDDWGRVGGISDMGTLQDVWAFAPDNVYVVGPPGAILHYDGNAWDTIAAPTNASLIDLFALGPDDIYAVGGNDLVHYDGSEWSVIFDSSDVGLSGLTSVWGSSPSDLYVVGDDAIIGHYDGANWTRTVQGSPFNSSVWGSGPDDVWVLGTFDLSHYDGTEWMTVNLDSGAGEGQVWGFGPNDVWIATDDDHVTHYDGVDYTEFPGDDRFIGGVRSVWGASPDDVWGVGTAGSISKFRGDMWEELAHQRIGAPELRQFFAIHGSSATDIWAVGHILDDAGTHGMIYHYNP